MLKDKLKKNVARITGPLSSLKVSPGELTKWPLTPRTTPSKKYIYIFSWNFAIIKICSLYPSFSELANNASVQLQTKIWKLFRRRSRFPRYTELSHITLLCGGRLRNVRFITHVHSRRSTDFGGILVTVVVFLSFLFLITSRSKSIHQLHWTHRCDLENWVYTECSISWLTASSEWKNFTVLRSFLRIHVQ